MPRCTMPPRPPRTTPPPSHPSPPPKPLKVHLCFRDRGLGEEAFLSAAAAAGWAAQEVPSALLHPEFQGGEYRALVLCML
jgi:hypothetical protein